MIWYVLFPYYTCSWFFVYIMRNFLYIIAYYSLIYAAFFDYSERINSSIKRLAGIWIIVPEPGQHSPPLLRISKEAAQGCG